MKIMYITFDNLNSNFAWAIHIDEVAKRLCRKGHTVLVLTPYKGSKPREYSIKTFPIGKLILLKIIRYFFTSIIYFLIYGLKFKPDIIYLRGAHLTLSPVIASKILSKPFVLEINGLLEDELQNKLVKSLFKIVQKIYFVKASVIITVSKLLKEGIDKNYNIPTDKIYVIPNGADCEKFKPMDRLIARKSLHLPEDKLIILYVGSFYRHHGLDILVESANKIINSIHEVLFLLVGDGVTKNEIQTKVKSIGLEKFFQFTGEIEHNAVPLYISASDICVCNVVKYSGFSPIKLYEYMASARPIICISNSDEIIQFIMASGIGLADALSNDKVTDIKNFADKLIILLQNEELRRKMGENGRQLALEKFSWDRAVSDVEKILIKVTQCQKN